MNRSKAFFLIIAILALILIFAGCFHAQPPSGERIPPPPSTRHAEMQAELARVTSDTQAVLDMLNYSLSDVAEALKESGISGPRADTILAGMASSNPAIIDVITYDSNGVVLAAEPAEAKILLNQDLYGSANVREALSRRTPMMTGLIALREGGEGVVLALPVISPGGEFLGMISAAYSPYRLIKPVIGETMDRTPSIFNIAQSDGRILFHPDPVLVGKPTFNETTFAAFPEILELARRYSAERSGYATFQFYRTGTDMVVEKETFWDTVALHGTEWRVMVIRER